MADWLDSEGIAQRTRDRILGHASDVRGRYGRKGILDPQIATKIEALEPPVIKQMREILLAAKNRVVAASSLCSRRIEFQSSLHCSEWRAGQNKKNANSYVIEIPL